MRRGSTGRIKSLINERKRSVLFGGPRLEMLLMLDYLRTGFRRGRPPRPRMIQLEPTRNCNLDCCMCIREKVKGDASMDLVFFRKIISRDFNYRHFLLLYGQGEPFLARDLFRMIRFERDLGNYVTTVTNGTVVDTDVCRQILHSGLNMLRISVDGASESTYDSVRRGASFRQVVRNVETLARFLRDERAGTKLALTFMALRENYREMPDLVSLASDLGIRYLEIKDLPPYLDSPVKPLALEIQEDLNLKHDLAQVLQKMESEAGRKGVAIIKTKFHCSSGTNKCRNPWFKTFITWDGKVTLCSRLYGPPAPTLGDLNQSAFAEIWNGPIYQSVRARLKVGIPPLDRCRTSL
ncbi:MAG: radical SAM protein [Candidatus Eisenbacteria bacterium]